MENDWGGYIFNFVLNLIPTKEGGGTFIGFVRWALSQAAMNPKLTVFAICVLGLLF